VANLIRLHLLDTHPANVGRRETGVAEILQKNFLEIVYRRRYHAGYAYSHGRSAAEVLSMPQTVRYTRLGIVR
jgi:hypothetical protein